MGVFVRSSTNTTVTLWVTHCQRSERKCSYLSHYSVSAAARVWMCARMKVLCRLLNLISQTFLLWESEAQYKDFCSIHNSWSCLHTDSCIQLNALLHVPDSLSLCPSGFLSGWSVALVTPRCASGTLRQVSVYTSSWAMWRRCAASSTTGGGWSAVPTTSWSKCGTPRRRPASTRCRATPTECTHYRWAASDARSVVCACVLIFCICTAAKLFQSLSDQHQQTLIPSSVQSELKNAAGLGCTSYP